MFLYQFVAKVGKGRIQHSVVLGWSHHYDTQIVLGDPSLLYSSMYLSSGQPI